MNKEYYVSLEVANMLREKGFKEMCRSYWWVYKKLNRLDSYDYRFTKEWLEANHDCYDDVWLAPTLYEAQKWLRENYRVYVSSLPTKVCGKTIWYHQITKDIFDDAIYGQVSDDNYKTYEEALNAGILEALKLI